MFHVTEFDCGTEVVWLSALKFPEEKLCFVLGARTLKAFEPDYRHFWCRDQDSNLGCLGHNEGCLGHNEKY